MSVQPARTLAYTGDRPDLRRLIPARCTTVLDVGCAAGALGAALKAERPGVRVTGIEQDSELAAVARERLDAVVEGDLEALDALSPGLEPVYDCIVCGDVLEHLRDPWQTLRRLREHVAPGGVVVASLPNAGHFATVANLVFARRWPYREVGIHDRTHLRFFALANVRALFGSAGLEIVELCRTYRLVEQGHRIDRLAPLLAVPPLRDLLTFQYLVVSRPAAG